MADADPRAAGAGGLCVVVLAAGEGTRMKSVLPKTLHGFGGRSMLGHVLAATRALRADVNVVVVGHGRDAVAAHLRVIEPTARAVIQNEQRGTGHAVRIALLALGAPVDTVLVVPGDAPLLTAGTLQGLLDAHRRQGAAATMLTSRLADPTGYGRVLRDPDGTVAAVVEDKDADDAQRSVDEVATGVYAFNGVLLHEAVAQLGTDNAQGEEYLPDVIAWLREAGHRVAAALAPGAETAGVNDRVQLAAAYRAYNERIVESHQRAGVSVLDAATTWIGADVTIEPDATVLPGVHLEGTTRIATGATIGPDCTLRHTTVGAGAVIERSVTDSVTIGPGATVGPFAYLRAQAELGARAKVGTFVEVKNATIGAGTKVPHLSYVGDATIGERTNIGASTVFANYDGVHKNRSVVGDDVRIGSDTTLVAPVRVGDGAYTGAGSVIRADVPARTLAVSMGPQRCIENWTSPVARAAAHARRSTETAPTTDDTEQVDA